MGFYLNPGNSGFSGIRNDLYVDKSGLIRLINETIDIPRRLTCVSRRAALENPLLLRCCAHIMIKPVILQNCLRDMRYQEMEPIQSI